jgi:hypothetical protein
MAGAPPPRWWREDGAWARIYIVAFCGRSHAGPWMWAAMPPGGVSRRGWGRRGGWGGDHLAAAGDGEVGHVGIHILAVGTRRRGRPAEPGLGHGARAWWGTGLRIFSCSFLILFMSFRYLDILNLGNCSNFCHIIPGGGSHLFFWKKLVLLFFLAATCVASQSSNCCGEVVKGYQFELKFVLMHIAKILVYSDIFMEFFKNMVVFLYLSRKAIVLW